MRDKYDVSESQVGVVGPKAAVHEITFVQDVLDRAAQLDMEKLAAQLESLKASLGSRVNSPKEIESLRALIEARDAAQKRDTNSVLSALRRAGKLAFEAAT